MRIEIEYTGSAWVITATKADDEVDEFELTELDEAQQAVSDIMRDFEEDYDPLDEVFAEDDAL
jgi:hypothetical protein